MTSSYSNVLIHIKATPKITSFKEKLQSMEEEIRNSNLKTLKTLQTFMSTCKWEESEQDLEHLIIKAASSYVHALLASFETYLPSHQTIELKPKPWIFKSFWRTAVPRAFGSYFQKRVLSTSVFQPRQRP